MQASPAQITLAWRPGPVAVNAYVVSRREPGAGSWTPLATLAGNATGYTDAAVFAGRAYEYQVVRQATGLTGYGYVASAIDLPAVDSRGRVILVVDQTVAGALSSEIAQWIRDAAGDGWTVVRRDVGRDASPAAVREGIRSAAAEDRARTQAVLLFGHIPVAWSGNLNVDGHGGRPLPADAYYGDIDGTWPDADGNGVLDPGTIPSDVELAVGRVDFADLPGLPAEVELLRRYLKKNHDFRHAVRRITPRALIGDRIGDFSGESFAATGFRNFSALLGPDGITTANVADNAPAAERWISRLTSADWLWVYGAGAGDDTLISGLGLHGPTAEVWAADLVQAGARGTFYLLFGSWFVDWSQPGNIMRAALAAPDYGLTTAWSGRPHLFFHRMALGETIGESFRLSQNNTTLYASQANTGTRGVHLALLGDPTLRLQVVAPPSGLSVGTGGNAPVLSWTASPDANAGYHVYRGDSETGPFIRVSNSPAAATSYTDSSAPAGSFTYMVRAVRREVSGSSSYFNLSQGTFAQATVTSPAPGVTLGNPAPAPGGGGGGGGGGAIAPGTLLALALLAWLRSARRR